MGRAGSSIPTTTLSNTKTRASAVLVLAGVALVSIFAAVPALAGRGLIQDLIFIFYMLALAQCWNLLAGYAGLVSVGQQAFVGLGGYLLFALTIGAGIDPIAAVVLSGLIAAIFAVPTAFVVFRLRGPYFAIGSWVVAEVYRLVFAHSSSSVVAPERRCRRRSPTRFSASNGSRRCSRYAHRQRATLLLIG